MSKNDGGSAFPGRCIDDTGYKVEGAFTTGFTKRELFAAMAMQGMLARVDFEGLYPVERGLLAFRSTECADALLAALDKEPQK